MLNVNRRSSRNGGSGRIIMASTMKTTSGTASARQGTARISGWLRAAAIEFMFWARICADLRGSNYRFEVVLNDALIRVKSSSLGQWFMGIQSRWHFDI